jgi:GT2 family glycosyltransferase
MNPKVEIVILNYQGERWLDACLTSVFRTQYDQFHVIVVDNASSDGSVRLIRERFPQVELIINEENRGFSDGNNVGIRRALDRACDYIVLLNPDTKATPEWLSELVGVGEELERVGIIGAVQLDYDSNELNSWTRSAFPHLQASLSQPDEAPSSIVVEWVEGACFAIKRQVLEDVGLLDPIYYAFYEEIDFCRRALLRGWETALAVRARIHHFRGGSWAADPAVKRERDYRCDRSQFIYTLTEPRRSFTRNVGWYFVTLGTKSRELLSDFSPGKAWDLLRMQLDVLSSSGALIGKWQRERQSRGSAR